MANEEAACNKSDLQTAKTGNSNCVAGTWYTSYQRTKTQRNRTFRVASREFEGSTTLNNAQQRSINVRTQQEKNKKNWPTTQKPGTLGENLAKNNACSLKSTRCIRTLYSYDHDPQQPVRPEYQDIRILYSDDLDPRDQLQRILTKMQTASGEK